MHVCKVDGVDSEDKAKDIKDQFEADGCVNVKIAQDGDTYTVTGQCDEE